MFRTEDGGHRKPSSPMKAGKMYNKWKEKINNTFQQSVSIPYTIMKRSSVSWVVTLMYAWSILSFPSNFVVSLPFASVECRNLVFDCDNLLNYNITHLLTAHEGNICFVYRESQCFPRWGQGKHFKDSRVTKQMFPKEEVIIHFFCYIA